MTKKIFARLIKDIEEGYFKDHDLEDFCINRVLPVTKDSLQEILEDIK